MSKKNFENHTLERVWMNVLREIVSVGSLVKDSENFLELQNIQVTYTNPFELEVSNYVRVFGSKFTEYIARVYSPHGDPETERNYYKLIYKNDGVNQVRKVIQKLNKDPYTRSATIVLADAKKEKLPCVSEINFSIRDEQLQMTVLFKSSDLGKKFIPDMIELSKIHKEISSELKIGRGDITAQILCAQLYLSDKRKVEKLLDDAHASGYFKTETVIENWDKEAANWDKYIKDPHHYVNFENGYQRFIDFMKNNLPAAKSTQVILALDSGCGTGVIAGLMSRMKYQVYAIDISPKMLHYAHSKIKKIEYVRGNSLDLPFDDDFFEVVCSRGVLVSHVGKKYTDLYFSEHNRVLKAGGTFVFDFITHFNVKETKKRKNKASFSYDKMKEIAQQHGFVVLGRSGDGTNRVNAIVCKKV